MIRQIRAQSRRDQVLILIFGVLIAYVICTLVIVLAAIPDYYQRVTTQTVLTTQLGSVAQMSNAVVAERASERGMTPEQYATYTILRSLVSLFVFGCAAFLILWKAGGNWYAWFAVFMLLFYPTGGTLNEINQATQVMGRFYGIGAVFWPLYLLFLYLFPNGKAVPKWTRWPVGTVIGLHLAIMTGAIFVGFGIGAFLLPVWQTGAFIVISVGFPLILISQVLRYRNHATPIERQQTKWFVGSLVFLVAISTIQTFLTGSLNSNENGWWGDLSSMFDLLIPISLVISILRYRLWDIDVIIRKTLVYTILTGALALLYFGLVTLLQSLSASVFGRQSPVITVLSTLAIITLFNPLRRRIQDFIDRRFYRRKYDAEKALARFAEAARNETDINCLNEALLEVVRETVQPESVSLWLRKGMTRR